jgi:hypothetical protein
MTNEQYKNIIEEQKNLKDLPNSTLINHMDLLTEEHERIKRTIIETTLYLDNLEELYNNTLKVYQQRTNEK